MKRFLRTFFIWISFAAFILSGCYYKPLEKFPAQQRPVSEGQYLVPAFHNILARGHIRILNQSMDGYFAFRRISDSSFRVHFSNDIGLTFFDLSVSYHEVKVNHVLKNLDKPALMNKAGLFFKVLLLDTTNCGQCNFKVSGAEKDYFIREKQTGNSFVYDKHGHLLAKKIRIGSKRIRISYQNYDEKGNFQDVAMSENGLIKLKIRFSVLKMK